VTRVAASSRGEARLRMLRLVRRGDRHDPRELTISFKLEGEFASADRADGVIPSEALKNLVYRITREQGNREIEALGLALAAEVLERQPSVTRVRVDLAEQPWQRVDIGGKAQAQAFLSGSAEQRVASITTNGAQTSVVAGIDDLVLMRSSGFAPARRSGADIPDDSGTSDGLQPLLVGALSARWTYTSGDVTFAVHRRAIRATIVETFVWQKGQSVQDLLYAIAGVVLATTEEIADVTLTFHERPYRPADLFAAGAENPDELFLVADEPVGTVHVTVERVCSGCRMGLPRGIRDARASSDANDATNNDNVTTFSASILVA
jgi:urate oxidase